MSPSLFPLMSYFYLSLLVNTVHYLDSHSATVLQILTCHYPPLPSPSLATAATSPPHSLNLVALEPLSTECHTLHILGVGVGPLLAVDDETLASLAAVAEGSRHPTIHEYLVYCSSSPRPGTTIGQMKSALFYTLHFKASSSDPSLSFKARNGVMYGLGSDQSYQWCKYLHSAWPWFDS